MIERFIHRSECLNWPEEDGLETGAKLREGLPRGAARRMTRLGLLCAGVLWEMPASPETAVVYATSMSETRTLEGYLDSFPAPSPTGFQASIHPAGAQQALIALARPTREFYPLVGGGNLLDQALQTCLLPMASEVVLVAGEESGQWLRDLQLAGDRSFAFAVHLSRKREGAKAVLRFKENDGDENAAPMMTLLQCFVRLSAGENWQSASFPAGRWEWEWL